MMVQRRQRAEFKGNRLASWAILTALLAPGAGWGAVAPPLPVQKITVAKMPPDHGHRLYVTDFALAHGVDGKVKVIDGDDFRELGMFSNGSFGVFTVAGDGRTLFNATTYFARGDHGARTEVLEFYDPATLLPTGEVILPPRRAQANGLGALLAESAGGAYLFVQNATPATSVSVVDLKTRRLLTEIPTAGCYGIYPAPGMAGRFSTLCGDGAVVTIGFDAAGHETGRQRSAVLFDPDKNPIFIPGAPDGQKTIFLSFLGTVHVMDLAGPVAAQDKTWSILDGGKSTAGWRPGGLQPIAYAPATGLLYVAMHPHGHEGSHKDDAHEIWAIALATHKIMARAKCSGVTDIVLSAGPAPLLFAVDADDGSIARYDARTLKKLGQSKPHLLEYAETMSVK